MLLNIKMFEKKNIKKNDKFENNKSFGILFFIVFILVSVWPLKNGEDLRIWSLLISLVFLFLGLINSKILTPLKSVWIKFGYLLGNIISPVVMGIIYFLVLTPTGLIMRLLGKDILKLNKNKLNTYWEKKSKNQSTMKNQF